MKKRRVLSGVMAGVMTVSSSLVFQLPAGAAEGSETVVDAQTVASWGTLDVNLREYGKMASGTVVKITSRTTATDIRDTDEEGNEVTPQWAFGIVINNEWSHAIMPHCSYDSSKTEFVMELTAEQLAALGIEVSDDDDDEEELEITAEMLEKLGITDVADGAEIELTAEQLEQLGFEVEYEDDEEEKSE